jgi:hypothetical protein
MKKNKLALSITSALFGVFGFGSAGADVIACQPDKLFFRTTQWLNAFEFNVSDISGTTPVEPVFVGNNPTPSAISLPAQGGTLWKSLEVAPGFKIKKALICNNALTPDVLAKSLLVSLSQSLNGETVTLNYERMAANAPNCGVYTVTGVVNELSNTVDPRKSPTILSVTTPGAPTANITAIGLRLQAIANSPLWTFVPYHQHAYLTGRGMGHNNTVALTSGPTNGCDVSTLVESSDLDDIADFPQPLQVAMPSSSAPQSPIKKGKLK